MAGRAAGHKPGNLPAELTSFVGRRRELAEIKRLLTTTRLLTLTGSGGVGKTRLAVQAAADLARSLTDGAWLVSLAPIEDPLLVTRAVFDALGLRDVSARWSLSALSDYLRGKRACCSCSTTASTSWTRPRRWRGRPLVPGIAAATGRAGHSLPGPVPDWHGPALQRA